MRLIGGIFLASAAPPATMRVDVEFQTFGPSEQNSSFIAVTVGVGTGRQSHWYTRAKGVR